MMTHATTNASQRCCHDGTVRSRIIFAGALIDELLGFANPHQCLATKVLTGTHCL